MEMTFQATQSQVSVLLNLLPNAPSAVMVWGLWGRRGGLRGYWVKIGMGYLSEITTELEALPSYQAKLILRILHNRKSVKRQRPIGSHIGARLFFRAIA